MSWTYEGCGVWREFPNAYSRDAELYLNKIAGLEEELEEERKFTRWQKVLMLLIKAVFSLAMVGIQGTLIYWTAKLVFGKF